MTEFLSVFSVYHMYFFTGITLLVVMIFFVKQNTEEFPHPDSCFDCDNKSCRKFIPLDKQHFLIHQKKLKPIASQSVFCLQPIEAIATIDTENLAN